MLSRVSRLDLEIIVVDSGSTDSTLSIIDQFDKVTLTHNPYSCHSDQMNFATSLATNDWVLCLDSDEIPTEKFISETKKLFIEFDLSDSSCVGRIERKWFVLGKPVHAMYPCSSPDYVVRFFNKKTCRFNGRKIDDKVIGFKNDFVMQGVVNHYTFDTDEALEKKLHIYVDRAKKHRMFQPSFIKAITRPMGAFVKWYFLKKAFLDGVVGLKTTWYAMRYTYYKYR